MEGFDINRIDDPRFFRDNVLPAHSDHRFYAPSEQALIDSRLSGAYLTLDRQNTDSFFRRYLNGSWKFLYASNYRSLPEGFETPEFDCHCWSDITVPAHIQTEGYDIPHYTNATYPWDGHEPLDHGEVPSDFNPACVYVKYFRVPAELEDMPLFISFQGVESAYALFLNGAYIGYSEDTFTPHDFELTDKLTPGENKLTVLVFKWATGSWLEDQDFFRFSGIFRDVFLYSVPKIHISDITVKAIPSADLTEGHLSLSILSTGKGRLKATLFSDSSDMPITSLASDIAEGSNSLDTFISSPALWSAECPALYRLRLELFNTNDDLCEVIPMRIGFRRFELSDGLMKLNGQRIVFKGVNRHEFSSLSGRAISFADTRKDLFNMKRNNINAIRTCHYPDNTFLYELADELGLYIIDETNLETHGTWSYAGRDWKNYDEVIPGDNPDWTDAVLDRVNSIYHRDRNHASILIWSCGNESFGGLNIFKMSERFRELDDTRLVHYEGVRNDRRYPGTSDMESQMYTPAAGIKRYLEEHQDGKPFICCEYSHAMGNSCGGMHKYTDLTDTEPRYQGGFIWDYIDQSLTVRDCYGVEFEAYGGDFGDRPTDYHFSGNGIAAGGPGRLSSPKMSEVKFNYRNISVDFINEKSFRVTNKNLFVPTSLFDCNVTLLQNGHPVASAAVSVNVAPLSSAEFDVPDLISAYFYPADGRIMTDRCEIEHRADSPLEFTLRVSFALRNSTAYAPAGHEISYGEYTFDVLDTAELPAIAYDPYKVVRGRHNLGIRGTDYEILFSGSGICSYKKRGVEMIKRIPAPVFWRAPVDNDRGCNEPQRYAQWKLADLYSTVTAHDVSVDLGRACVSYTYTAPTSPAATFTVTYTVEFDGRININMHYDPVDGLIDMPVFGIGFCFDSQYDQLKWYGYGPDETYPDRCHGNPLGIYRSTVRDSLAPYLKPQECGNHMGVRRARVTDRRGRGVEFTGNSIHFQALPCTAHELESAYHPNELPPFINTYVRISSAQQGIGGDDSWHSTCLEEYFIDVTRGVDLDFTFKCI